VCPVGATYVNEDGIVLVNDEICIGCGACIQNCPYGARFFNPIKGVAEEQLKKWTGNEPQIFYKSLPAEANT